ncbi:MAG: acylneuraminate cytidylyltransferase family protein [Parvularculaceae bacterium]
MTGKRSKTPRLVALIPARAGSKRIRDKNIAPLAGHPLIAYTICAARASGVCDSVIVSTDSADYAEIARHYGAEVPFLRPAVLAGDKSADIEWIRHALDWLERRGRAYECFSILRPTSPCRKPETIARAWKQFLADPGADSLRAVELCAQHPGKMWIVRGRRMHPLLPMPPTGSGADGATPYHSTQYAALPRVHVQNASLEIAWTRVATEGGTIAGDAVAPFLTRDDEGVDLNRPADWRLLELMLADGTARLPEIDRPAFTRIAAE